MGPQTPEAPERLPHQKLEEEELSASSEPFPDDLLAALRTLATDAQVGTDGGNESPQKRRRVEQTGVDSIPVLREVFTISRPVRSGHSISGQITCHDAGRYLRFYWDERSLTVRSKPNTPCDAFECDLYPGQSFVDTTRAALEVLDHSREDKTQDGALTVLTTISLHENDATHHLCFTLVVNFNTATHTVRNTKQRGLSQPIMDVLGGYRPNESFPNPHITANEFYEAAFMPDRDSFDELSTISIPGLETSLYPFQRRALQWLLMREQVSYSCLDPDGELELVPHPKPAESVLPFSFNAVSDANGQQFYVSHLYHIVTRDIAPFQDAENSLRGGILAEEMGLGKTVEIISLILTHRRDPYHHTEVGTSNIRGVQPTGATLIVTPDTLQNQWLSEFKKHAPHLLVMKYPGMKVWAKDKTLNAEKEGESLMSWITSKLTNCDVVITTYSVLQAEVHYAAPPPERSMRYERKHERHTSPLIQISWWRLCLDEAQQIDSGVSSAAKVACEIPRVNAWAVTGTPVKDDPSDLWGLLLFLRYEPFASCQFVWKALLKTYKGLFGPLFNKIAIRHSKQAVRDELRLPSQRRYAVTMPFTAIEEHHYQSQFKELVAKAGLSEQGTPFQVDWDPNDPSVIDFMKKALASLRQTVLHPELGSGAAKTAVYRTLVEHLETMIEQSEAYIRIYQRSYLVTKLNRGQLLENSPRVREALQIWQEVLKELDPIVVEIREELQKALENAQQEQAKSVSNQGDNRSPDDESEGEESPDEDTLETAKVGECRRKLRPFLDLQHRATFFIASAFFQIKSAKSLTKPDSDEFRRLEEQEVEGYETARKFRREILQEALRKASKLMGKLQQRADTQSFVDIPEIVIPDLHGIETGQVAAELRSLGLSLNQQADVIDEWREHIIQLLLMPLVDAEDEQEITGEEYDNSTKVQDHLMVYTLALGAIIADRQEALTGLVNERVRHEVDIAKGRANYREGHAPKTLLELLQTRQDVKPLPAGTSFRKIVVGLREISTKLRHDASAGSHRARLELQIVTTLLKETQGIFTKQSKVVLRLERDLEFFTTTMNRRVAFYHQLQSISDNVAPLKEELVGNSDATWNNYVAQEDELRKKAKHWRANCRHLMHMREEGFDANEPCPICCSDDFTVGAITTCGHSFCKECIVHWVRLKHRCPFCKEYQTSAMLSEFNNRKKGAAKARTLGPHLQGESTRGWEIYSNIPDDTRRAIQNVKLYGPSYSTKVDTLVKHLIWLRGEDPGAKSIIFTQFRSFFTILEQALKGHHVGFAAFSRMGNKSLEIQRFQDDPSIECLLMDAKAHSSGLNLVNASHVFLCEPLLNTALELQATARVDRIGQEHETTVWLYLIEGTVEENIHTLSERRRLAHVGGDKQKGKSKAITEEDVAAASSREFRDSSLAKLMNGGDEGEVVDNGDLWECLFGYPVSG